jgi:hypothetical protein
MSDIHCEESFRVFISYSHEDLPVVTKLVDILKENKICPMWDRRFAFGHAFHDQIKTFISHSHVFLPIISPSSIERGWVHQEIGYAMALNIPVLPVAMGKLPNEMIRELHAIPLDKEDLETEEKLHSIKNLLSYETMENLVNRFRDPTYAQYQCAEFTEDRAILFAKYANTILAMRFYGMVRQKGGLSSFHIPDKLIAHEDWDARYGGISSNRFHRRSLRSERIALDKHANEKGCKLIVNPSLSFDKYGWKAKILRLTYLKDYINDMLARGKSIEVAIDRSMKENESITIVGDWFLAESYSSALGTGFRQTIFTTHAPSMKTRIETFEHEFEHLLKKMGCDGPDSARRAIDYIDEEIKRIESDPKNIEKVNR